MGQISGAPDKLRGRRLSVAPNKRGVTDHQTGFSIHMTFRAILIGVLLGLAIACFTHFNDQVIRQTFLIGHHLPPVVFGFALLLLLLVNPLLRLIGARWVLRPGEIALIIALGLVVCGWPGSNLMRIYGHLMAVPAQQRAHQPHWESASVFAYVPGGPPYVAEGYVRDWPTLLRGLQEGEAPILAAIRARLDQPLQRELDEATAIDQRPEAGVRRQLLRAVNTALARRDLLAPALPAEADTEAVVRRHRAALDAALPGVFKPAPAGEGIVLNEGEPAERSTNPLFAPSGTGEGWPSVSRVDWSLWWPVLRLWIGLALLVGVATLCMIMIVHPQWIRRELLPYPTVRFVEEVTAWTPGRWLPNVATRRLFWIGVAVVVVIHTLNGLHVWFPQVPDIPRDLNLNPLRNLFPNASRASGSAGLFHPTIFFAVVGFGFFIQTRVSLSVGLSLVFWVMLSAFMLGWGLRVNNGRFSPEAMGPALRFGAYLGLTLMVLLLGRRYYLGVARGAVGLKRGAEVPGYAVWALRVMLLCIGAAGWLLVRYGGVGWVMALALIGSVLMIGLVLTRINAETGLFYAQPDFVPAIIFAGFLGWEGIGPEALIVLLIGSLVLVADPRGAIGPYVGNGLAMVHRLAGRSPARAAWPLGVMLVLGLIAAVIATLAVQHHFGLSDNGWAWGLPRGAFNQLTRAVNELAAHGQLEQLTGLNELTQLAHARPDGRALGWAAAGLALVLGCAAARLRLAWWPLHPVLFLIWGTYPARQFAFSFLLAAAVKGAITTMGGARAYHHAKPLMVGFIAAEIFMVIVWSIVGLGYFLATNQTPERYMIFPG